MFSGAIMLLSIEASIQDARADKKPEGHVMHFMLFTLSVNSSLDSLHKEHEGDPSVEAYVPSKQASQLVAPLPLVHPAGQSQHVWLIS